MVIFIVSFHTPWLHFIPGHLINYELTPQAHCWVQTTGIISYLCQLQSHHPLYKETLDRGCPCLCGLYHKQVSVGGILVMQLPWLWRDTWRVWHTPRVMHSSMKKWLLVYLHGQLRYKTFKSEILGEYLLFLRRFCKALLHKLFTDVGMGTWECSDSRQSVIWSSRLLDSMLYGFRQWFLPWWIIFTNLFGLRGSNVKKMKSWAFLLDFVLRDLGRGGMCDQSKRGYQSDPRSYSYRTLWAVQSELQFW